MEYLESRYPRTEHLEGSKGALAAPGERMVPFSSLWGRTGAVEIKIDGTHSGFRFGVDGSVRLHLRGRDVSAEEERVMPGLSWLKGWVEAERYWLWPLLGTRYRVHGELLLAMHTVFYDCLPSYFLESEVQDLETGEYLSTEWRKELFRGTSLRSVPVLYHGVLGESVVLESFDLRCPFKSDNWRGALLDSARESGVGAEDVWKWVEDSNEAEGIYLKVETENGVEGRYKWVREGFLRTLLSSGSHWKSRPLVRNRLAPDALRLGMEL